MSSTRQVKRRRGETGQLWQGRFFDRALRTVKEYQEKEKPQSLGKARLCATGWPGEASGRVEVVELPRIRRNGRLGTGTTLRFEGRSRTVADRGASGNLKEKPQSLGKARLCATGSNGQGPARAERF